MECKKLNYIDLCDLTNVDHLPDNRLLNLSRLLKSTCQEWHLYPLLVRLAKEKDAIKFPRIEPMMRIIWLTRLLILERCKINLPHFVVN